MKRFVLVGILALVVAISGACAQPESTATPTSTPTLTPSPLPTAMPTPTPTPTPAPAATPLVIGQAPESPQLPGNDPTVSFGRAFIQLVDPLDEPEYYCVHVPGAGSTVRLEVALQAHTCKPVAQADDELFTLNHPDDGQIFIAAYNLCVEADGPGAELYLHIKPCSDSPLQRFAYTPDGQIQLETGTGEKFCLAVASGVGASTRARLDDEFLPGGPNHVRRDLTLQSCRVIEPPLSTWTIR